MIISDLPQVTKSVAFIRLAVSLSNKQKSCEGFQVAPQVSLAVKFDEELGEKYLLTLLYHPNVLQMC